MAEFKYDDFRGYEKKSYARLEFWALAEDIAPLLDKGLSTKAIYRYFKDKERLTMCYQTFAYYMRSQKNPEHSPRARAAKSKPVEAGQQVPKQPAVAVDSVTALSEQPGVQANTKSPVPLGVSQPPVDHNHRPDVDKDNEEIFGK